MGSGPKGTPGNPPTPQAPPLSRQQLNPKQQHAEMLHPTPCPATPGDAAIFPSHIVPQAKRVGKGHPPPGNSRCLGDVPVGMPTRHPPITSLWPPRSGSQPGTQLPTSEPGNSSPDGKGSEELRRRGCEAAPRQSIYLFIVFLHISTHSLLAQRGKKAAKWERGGTERGAAGQTCLARAPACASRPPVAFSNSQGRDPRPSPDLGARTTPFHSSAKLCLESPSADVL